MVSPGTQKRNFTHVDDIINGIILVGENGFGDNYGIGSPESFSIIDIANMFNEAKIQMLPERPGNRMEAELMTQKIQDLGWKPKNKIIDYIKNFKNE